MDKTLEIVVAAAVIVVIGAIAGYLVNSEASNFTGFIGGQTDKAECTKYQGDDRSAFTENNCQEVLGETFEGEETAGDTTNDGDTEDETDSGGGEDLEPGF